uniref:Uncharacterized protein n=1 Tax=Steinernema glaseri TaxID=37863 RepID=A0A1I7Y2J5_9BILA
MEQFCSLQQSTVEGLLEGRALFISGRRNQVWNQRYPFPPLLSKKPVLGKDHTPEASRDVAPTFAVTVLRRSAKSNDQRRSIAFLLRSFIPRALFPKNYLNPKPLGSLGIDGNFPSIPSGSRGARRLPRPLERRGVQESTEPEEGHVSPSFA